jgi:hypothetical protein
MRIDGTRTAQGPQDTGVLLAAISCPDLIGASVLTVTGAVPKPYVRSQNESDRLHLALDAIQGRDLADEECRPYVSGHHQVRERQERLRVDLRHRLVSASPQRLLEERGTRRLVVANSHCSAEGHSSLDAALEQWLVALVRRTSGRSRELNLLRAGPVIEAYSSLSSERAESLDASAPSSQAVDEQPEWRSERHFLQHLEQACEDSNASGDLQLYVSKRPAHSLREMRHSRLSC